MNIFINVKSGYHMVSRMPSAAHVTHLALPAVHRLLVELLAHHEVDLGGAHGGGGLDVEVLLRLPDLHLGLGGGRHRHLPQHGVHTWNKTPHVMCLICLYIYSILHI